jgi:hypothetical protein
MKGFIYILRSHQTEDVYYGSTEDLSERMRTHKKNYKMWLNEKHNYITSYEIVKYKDAYMELLEEIEYNNKQELTTRVGYYIRNNICVNKVIPHRTRTEWREDKKDIIREKKKIYRGENVEYIREKKKKEYEENKEKILERSKKFYEENKDEKLEYAKKYYEANKEKKLEYQKAYAIKHKEEIKIKESLRKKEYRINLTQEQKDKKNENNRKSYQQRKLKARELPPAKINTY